MRKINLFRFLQFSSILLLLVVSSSSCGQPKDGNKSTSDHLAERFEITDIDRNWKLFRHNVYKFSFTVPSTSRINSHRFSQDSERIRIQNFKAVNDNYSLNANNYFLEIYLFRHSTKQKIWLTCPKMFLHYKIDIRNDVKIYQGTPNNISPDAGGYVEGLCAETDKFDIYMRITEANKNLRIQKSIFKSFNLEINE